MDRTKTSFPIATANLTPINPRPPKPAIPIFNPPLVAPQYLRGSYKVIPAQNITPAAFNGYESGILIANLSLTTYLLEYPPYV